MGINRRSRDLIDGSTKRLFNPRIKKRRPNHQVPSIDNLSPLLEAGRSEKDAVFGSRRGMSNYGIRSLAAGNVLWKVEAIVINAHHKNDTGAE